MKQINLAESGFARTSKVTRKQVFLAEKERVVPWDRLRARIEPQYPVAGNGTQPYPLTSMLRIHLMQQWFGYSDPPLKVWRLALAERLLPYFKRIARAGNLSATVGLGGTSSRAGGESVPDPGRVHQKLGRQAGGAQPPYAQSG